MLRESCQGLVGIDRRYLTLYIFIMFGRVKIPIYGMACSLLIFELSFAQNSPDSTKVQVPVREPQVVYEGELEIAPMSEKELNYTFYRGDEISLTAKPVKGKDISRFTFQRMGQPAIAEYKSKPILDMKFSISVTDAYTFVFENTALLSGKALAIKISRKASNDSTQALDVAVKTETTSDTSYVELLQKSVRLGRGIFKSNVETFSLTIPAESDGNTAFIVGSDKEVSDWMGTLPTKLPGIDPASAIIGGLVVQSVAATGGKEINWFVTDSENAQLAVDAKEFKAYYASHSISFETKSLQLHPGQTYYVVLGNPSSVSAKDIQIQAKARVIHQQTRTIISR